MSDIIWLIAVFVILAVGFFGMGKLGDFMDRNREYRKDLFRMRHKG